MSFKVLPAKQLEVGADRIQATILMPRYRNMKWTPESLRAELEKTQQSIYSLDDVKAVVRLLKTCKIIEDV